MPDSCFAEELTVPIPRIKVIDRTYAAILAAKSPMERIAMTGEMYRTARVIVEAGVRYRHPDWTDAQIAAEVAFRMAHGST